MTTNKRRNKIWRGAADFSDGAAKEGTIIENTEPPGNVFGADTSEEFLVAIQLHGTELQGH